MKQKDIIFILFSSVFLVVCWIIFSILHQSLTSTISESVGQDIVPIAKTFDTQTITVLKKRLQVTPAYDVVQEPTPTPTPIPPKITPLAPLSSQSAQVATQGGTQ